MRKLPVLTSLAAALALLSAPVISSADTLYAVDPPDINIAPGNTAGDTFNLDDFFDSTSGSVSYSAAGGSVSGNVASVFGLSNPGSTQATFTGSNGTDSLDVTSGVWVSSFNLGGAPDINNNNRIAGTPGGNKFANYLAGGGTASGAISGLPAGGSSGGGTGGGVTGGGVTGGAALIATISSVGLNTNGVTGLRSRSTGSGAGAASVTLNADGSYEVVASDNITGNYIVTLGASSGGGTDAVHLLVSAGTDVDANGFAGLKGGTVSGGVASVAAGADELFFGAPIAVSGEATVVLYYSVSSADVAVAVIGFEGVLGGAVSFSNASGSNIEANANKAIAVSMTSNGNSIIPAFQLASTGGPATITVNRIVVASAGPLADFALNPNATANLGANASSTAGWIADILASGASGPGTSGDNNFESASGSGSMSLDGAGGVSNASVIFAAPQGEVAAEVYVKRSGGADAGSLLAVVITSVPQATISTFVSGGAISDSSWSKQTVSGTLSVADPGAILTVQAAGLNAVVDDISVRIITDKPEHFDADLLG